VQKQTSSWLRGRLPKVSGYMEMEIREFRQISGMENINFTCLKVRKINKTTRVLAGPVLIKSPEIDNDVKIEHHLYKKQGEEYQHQKQLQTVDQTLKFQKNYSVNGYTPNLKDVPLYVFSSGDYMVETFWKKNGETMIHYQMFGSLINLN
jgi:hypothetical protein